MSHNFLVQFYAVGNIAFVGKSLADIILIDIEQTYVSLQCTCDLVSCTHFYLETFLRLEYLFTIYGSELFSILVDINGVSVIKCADRLEVSTV